MQKPKNYHHSNIPSPLKKPKPIFQKIIFSKEEQEEMNIILEGKRNKYTKHLTPISTEYKKKLLKQQYYKGICGLCSELPEYRVLYDMGGATLLENYCEKHFKEYFPNELI